MRTIVHISDLHFGRVDQATTQPLLRQIQEIHPDLLVISGDLTQRDRSWQFQEARAFLEALPKPQIVVPGNHDVPAYNLLKRFFEPLKRFHRYITEETMPSYVDDEVAVFGLNSTLSLTTKYGRLRERDVAAVCEKLIHPPQGPYEDCRLPSSFRSSRQALAARPHRQGQQRHASLCRLRSRSDSFRPSSSKPHQPDRGPLSYSRSFRPHCASRHRHLQS